MSHTIPYGNEHACTGQRAPLGIALLRAMERVAKGMGGWIERSRQRRALGELDDRSLQDIGITRNAATREAAKAFWRE